MKKKWITLFPETFLWIKFNKGLIYNSNNFCKLHFTANKRIKELCDELLKPVNLYSTSLENDDFINEEVSNWIDSITKIYNVGYVTSMKEKATVSFVPNSKLLIDVKHYIWEHNEIRGCSIMQNIHELTFYVNNSDSGNNNYYKQVAFPLKNCSMLDSMRMLSFIQYCQNPFLLNINLVGNIFKYPDYQKLIKNISSLIRHCTIMITYQDFSFYFQELIKIKWPENISMKLLISSFSAQHDISLQDLNIPISVNLLVFSENDYDLYFDQFRNVPVFCDAQVIPVFNGENSEFLEQNVYTQPADLDEIKLTKREIFIHQTLNTNDFGKLTILPDSSVYANINMNPLGKLDDSPYLLVFKEFTEGKSFFRIRNQAPCADCIYQWLCQSPSNYELAIGKSNLCHVNH